MTVYKPGRCNNAHIILPLILTGGATAAFFGSSYTGVFAPALLQAVAMLMLCSAIYIIIRYSTSSFYYTLDEDTPDLLCVHRITGRRQSLPCTADMKRCTALTRPVKGKKAEGAKPDRRINACANLFSPDAARLVFELEGGVLELTVEADDEFYDLLLSRITNRNPRAEDE